ncbi:MAG: AtpZ/AtpI family protein [Spirochaetia bacterium]|nr:AtpZ/AtpI family protein [Spirochaetia bacterium]
MLDEHDKEDIKKRLQELDEKDKKYFINKDKKDVKSVKYKETANTLIKYTHLGLEFCAILLIFLFSGKYIDTKLNSAPWIMLLFIVLGFFLGLFRIVKAAKDLAEN